MTPLLLDSLKGFTRHGNTRKHLTFNKVQQRWYPVHSQIIDHLEVRLIPEFDHTKTLHFIPGGGFLSVQMTLKKIA